MADFIRLPIVDDLRVSNNGSPFKDSAWLFATASGGQGMYIATDNGTVYAARVGSFLYIVCIGYGYFAYTWFAGTNFTRKWEVAKTDWTSIYTVQTLSVTGTWVAELTEFETEVEMLERFYDTIVFPGVTPLSGDITVLLNPKHGYSEINVDLPINIAGADSILVSGKASTIDPNNSGGNSGESVPSGNFDDSSDPIPVQPIPTISAANVGLVTLFKPTQAELKNLGSYMWTHLTDFIENLQKFFTNPMDYMIALNIMPCNPTTGTERPIKIGNWITTINMSPVISQWYEFDCGMIQISPYWGSALDFSPNTKITMMLPFIGSVALNTDEVMGQTIGLIYRMDLLSGNCVAMVTVNGDVLYQFTGECAVPVPMTGSDWSRIYSAFVGAVVAVGVGAVGATAAMSAANGVGSMLSASTAATNASKAVSSVGRAFNQVNKSSKGIAGVRTMRENLLAASDLALQAGEMASSAPAQVGRALRSTRIANTVNNVATNVMSAKTQIQHTGTVSGSSGMLGNRIPYVMIEYPNQSLAENYKHYVGYPSNMTASLGSLSGYTECEQLILSGITATDPELEEITEALKGGVYL